MTQRLENGRRMRIAVTAAWPVGVIIATGLTISCAAVSAALRIAA